MNINELKPVGIFYEHPVWFESLFNELESRNIPFVKIHAEEHTFNPAEQESPYSLVINRMSSSAHLRDHKQATFHTANYLYHLERIGTPIINGVAAQTIESSKSKQIDLLTSLGLAAPNSRAINHISQIVPAAKSLKFPIVVKANIGGSGAGIVRFDTLEGLENAVAQNQLDLGIDYTGLVQEYLKPKDDHIVRVETLNGKFLYAMKVYTTGESFNLCPAELCQIPDPSDPQACLIEGVKSGLQVESYTPSQHIINQVEQIAKEANLDVCGVEYLTSAIDDQVYFYDINALSNFVANAETVVGFNPYKNFVDYIEDRIEKATNKTFKKDLVDQL